MTDSISIAEANFLLGWRNLVFAEDATWDLAEGTVTAGALANLATMQLSDRVTIVSDTVAAYSNASIILHWYVAEADAARIDLIGLLNYAVSAPADADTAIITMSVLGVSGTVDVEDQTVGTWQRPSDDFPNHSWAVLPDGVFDGYWVTVHVSATMGATGGAITLTAGALWASALWTLPAGLEAGWGQIPEDNGVLKRSKGNQGYARRGSRYRRFRGRATKVPFEYAYGSETDPDVIDIQQLLYRVGTTEPIVLFPRTRNAAGVRSVHVMHRLGVYGHFERLGEIVEDGGDHYAWSGVEVAELM